MVDKKYIVIYLFKIYILYILLYIINKVNNRLNKKIKKNNKKIYLLKKKIKYYNSIGLLLIYNNYNVVDMRNLYLICMNKSVTIFLPCSIKINIGKVTTVKNFSDGLIYIESKINIINNLDDNQIINKIKLRPNHVIAIILLNLDNYMVIS